MENGCHIIFSHHLDDVDNIMNMSLGLKVLLAQTTCQCIKKQIKEKFGLALFEVHWGLPSLFFFF